MEFIHGVLDGSIQLSQLHPRVLADWHYYWSVRYDESYSPEEYQQITHVMRQLEVALAPHLLPQH